jgi:dipeptidyl aminopeptidase/acylaminoacyl peptidase
MGSHIGKRAITAEDLKAIRLVSDPKASPDGKRIAWVVTQISSDKDSYTSAIWVANRDGSNAHQLTSGAQRDASPRWSADSTTLAFVSNRAPVLPLPETEGHEDVDESGKRLIKDKTDKKEKTDSKPKNQIWRIRVDGGEASQVTNHPNGAGSPTWSPDGSRIAFVATDDVADDDDFEAPMTNGGVADERIVRDIRYRSDGRGYLERYAHIWCVDVDSGEATQLTTGDVNDDDPQWSPNGDTVAFVGNRRDDRKMLGARTILTVPASGGAVRTLAPDDASFAAPAWSPDGTRIAFVGHLDAKNGGARNNTLWTVTVEDSQATNHTEQWDTTVGDMGMSDVHAASDFRPIWLTDASIAVLASANGETQIHRVDPDNSSVACLTEGKRRISGFTVSGDQLIYVSGNIHKPFELHISGLDGSGEQRITSTNQTFLEEVDLSEAIELSVTAADGKNIQTWLLPPHGFDAKSSARHPLVVEIHGGPHAMYGYAMFHEMQLMAARGYAVLFCNPRGSSGYGEEFTGITRARWGESDMPDVMAALDAALELPWIDRDRLGVTGGSYGGYLTNWIIAHDDRFKAAVTQRCVSNFYSFFGTSDIGYNFGEFEFGGVPWKDAELLLKYSPISYVDNITTPLLILHSEQDLRCPIEQAEQMFNALKYLGRDVSFVRIPEESHDLSRSGTPSRRLARLHHLMGWFDTYL